MSLKRLRLSSTLISSARQLCETVINTLLPPSCPLCGEDLDPEDAPLLNCGKCAAAISVPKHYCLRCSGPAGPFQDTTRGCVLCRRDRFAFEGTFAIGEYRDALKRAVLGAKRAGGESAAAWLAERLWEKRGPELAGLSIDLVVPIPQHWTGRLIRPYNPPELIARRLGRRLKTRVDRHILQKTRWTPAQVGLSPTGRRKNLRDAFLATGPVAGRRILLIDDVLTTGTTSDRASRALRDAGAAAIWVAVAARGVGV